MPYLHWETDRQRSQFSEWMRGVTKNIASEAKTNNDERKGERQRQREGLPKPKWLRDLNKAAEETRNDQNTSNKDEQNSSNKEKQDWNNLFKRIFKRGLDMDRLPGGGRRVKSDHKLGQYLLDASMLYESMSNHRDKEFIKKYLHEDPPLHPRRTLDQAYYWSLDNTDARDQDQVVYRATKATAKRDHTYDSENMVWKQHRKCTLKDGCEHCRSKIRHVPKLVMVDQLWMWILDGSTVLTFFPRRYGSNKHDLSGVHKAIRGRVKTARKNRIQSAFDLGLLIIEECWSTFFDRTKRPDPKQPQVIDQFAQAIADVVSAL